MLSSKVKKEISDKVQEILQQVQDDELPKGEISFLLHIDGAEGWSWANIRNNKNKDDYVPNILIQNLTSKKNLW